MKQDRRRGKLGRVPVSSLIVFALALTLIGGLYAVTPFDSSIQPAISPLEIPANRGAAALWQSLRKLHTRASMIMITAHPDDEDGGTLTYESRGAGARVSLLTLNRGEGGAIVMSSDFWDALGLVRTQELLAAGRYYGVDQYWTRVCDYGFSKTIEEALSKWTDDRVLGDVVRVVRMARPLVVTSVFVGGPSDGHGNHQTAGRMAQEVFDAAGDPSRFPEQIAAGLRPWKPLKRYAHLPFTEAGKSGLTETVSIPTGTYDALLGESYVQLSREGLGQQKSQNGGPFIPRTGASPAPYHRFAPVPSADGHEQSFFDGIDISLPGIAELAGAGDHAFLDEGLRRMESSVNAATEQFSPEHPDRCAPALAHGLKTTTDLLQATESSNLADATKYDVLHELRIKQAQFNSALIEALGISLRATVRPDKEVDPLFAQFMGDPDTFRMAIPGQQFGVQVSLASAASDPIAIHRVYLQSPNDNAFKLMAAKTNPSSLSPNTNADWQFEAKVTDLAPYTKPYFARPSFEQPYYDILIPADTSLPLAPYPLNAWAEISYHGLILQIGQAVQTVQHVTGAGVLYEPLTIAPAISVQVSPRAGVIPLDRTSFNLAVTIHSNVKGPAQGSVVLQLPEQWKSNPPEAPFQTRQDGEDQALSFSIEPSRLSNKSYQIAAIADYQGKKYKEGYSVTGYQGVRPYSLYRYATYKAIGTDVKVAPNLKVAYITGSGDDVPASLAELGVKVTFLTASDLAGTELGHFDVILLGIRAYAARSELATYNGRLLEYVRNGGVLIVQYNTPEFDHNFGPFPYRMGTEPEEVTDEESKVTILDPSNPLFSWPNKITEADFGGWVEERGSKFLTTWDNRYSALLETHDPDQAPQKGGLLYAKYGKGVYIYNAYALYRELPEGVPGAFRLLANMLSLPKNPQK